MRGILLVSSVIISALLVGCTDSPSVASAYKIMLTEGADSLPPPSQGSTPIQGSGNAGADTGDEDPVADVGDEEQSGAGDAAAGAALLTSCKGCHATGGIAANVAMNADAIDRLDDAYTGAQKGLHASFSNAFVAQRADLEAALDAAP